MFITCFCFWIQSIHKSKYTGMSSLLLLNDQLKNFQISSFLQGLQVENIKDNVSKLNLYIFIIKLKSIYNGVELLILLTNIKGNLHRGTKGNSMDSCNTFQGWCRWLVPHGHPQGWCGGMAHKSWMDDGSMASLCFLIKWGLTCFI